MNFEEFIRSGKVRKSQPDTQHTKALIKMSEAHINFLRLQKIDETSATTLFVMYYEALREIIEAIATEDGYKVYSHEAFTAYLEKLKDYESAAKYDRLRKMRNAANYYGKPVDANEANASAEEIIKLIEKIKQRYLEDLL